METDGQSLHGSLPAFSPVIPTSVLPFIALLFLSAFFALTFTFTAYVLSDCFRHWRSAGAPWRWLLEMYGTHARLPKSRNPLPELGTGLLASGFAGLGLVALFCTLGVYV
jgi:hypothetical protein